MQPFTTFAAVAAPMPEADVDTDVIFPARFLTITKKRGLGVHAFRDRRYDAEGRERDDFVLNRAPWRHAGVLVTGPNFGCGSSREQAPWAIADLGVRALVGPSFGAIFEANCHRNGIVPARVDADDHARLMEFANGAGTVTVDLAARRIDAGDGRPIPFAIPDDARDALLSGEDEIDTILRTESANIAAFETRHRQRMPWLFPTER